MAEIKIEIGPNLADVMKYAIEKAYTNEKINEVINKLTDITKDIKENGEIVHDWASPFLKSSRSSEAYDILREFTKWLEEKLK